MFTTGFSISVLIAFLSLSAFFSASETALFSIPRERILYFQSNTKNRYFWVFLLLKEGQRTLLLILIGNIFVNVTIAGLIHSLLLKVWPHGSPLLTLIVATVVIVFIGEMIPKNIALKNNEKIAVVISPILYHLELLFTPVLTIIQKVNSYFLNLFKVHFRRPSPFITIEELKTGIERSANNGAISLNEKNMIIGILGQGSEPVRKLMIHRSSLLLVPDDATVEHVIKKMSATSKNLAIVISRDDSRRVLGIVHVRDCIKISLMQNMVGSLITAPIEWVPETMEAADLINFLFSGKYEEVCVLDQFGSFSGIISVSSCISDIMKNAFHREVEAAQTGESAMFEGIQDIAFIGQWLPRSLVVAMPNMRTLNGLLTNYIGGIPKSGDSVEIDGYNFYILKASPTRIESVLISKGT